MPRSSSATGTTTAAIWRRESFVSAAPPSRRNLAGASIVRQSPAKTIAGAGLNPFQLGAGARHQAIEWVNAILDKVRFGRGRWQQFM